MSALVRKSQLCLWFGRVKIPEGRLTGAVPPTWRDRVNGRSGAPLSVQ
jgi:hypothetical protein